MRVILLFDYIYYRIYQFFKEKGDPVPETKGTLVLSLIQFFTILDIMAFVKLTRDFPFPSEYYFLFVLISLAALNWIRYERKFEVQEIISKWKHESTENRKRNGWMIGIYLILSFLIPVLYGYLKVNLKVI